MHRLVKLSDVVYAIRWAGPDFIRVGEAIPDYASIGALRWEANLLGDRPTRVYSPTVIVLNRITILKTGVWIVSKDESFSVVEAVTESDILAYYRKFEVPPCPDSPTPSPAS